MKDKPRVGIVTHRFICLGGVQTCFIELVVGLNQLGIIPEVIWDEPTDWEALMNPAVRTGYRAGKLAISSRMLRRLPQWLARSLKYLSVRHARFALEEYDFVYSFEPGVRMSPHTPNLCYMCGPPFLRMPGEEISLIWPPFRRVPLDKHSRYVTLSEWIAALCRETFGYNPPVIWPPARARMPLGDETLGARSGFLFLSRLTAIKKPEVMLILAQAFPAVQVTIAGSSLGPHDPIVLGIRDRIAQLNLANVTLVDSPSEQEVSRLLARHAFFVFPAAWEHFGIVTVEAIQGGLVPLVHNSGGQREIVPLEELRFEDERDLVQKAEALLSMNAGSRQEIMGCLTQHVRRGSPERFRAAMLNFMCRDLGLPPLPEGDRSAGPENCRDGHNPG